MERKLIAASNNSKASMHEGGVAVVDPAVVDIGGEGSGSARVGIAKAQGVKAKELQLLHADVAVDE